MDELSWRPTWGGYKPLPRTRESPTPNKLLVRTWGTLAGPNLQSVLWGSIWFQFHTLSFCSPTANKQSRFSTFSTHCLTQRSINAGETNSGICFLHNISQREMPILSQVFPVGQVSASSHASVSSALIHMCRHTHIHTKPYTHIKILKCTCI